MQLILELLNKIFVALQGVYTKQESDSALATETQAREQVDVALGERISTGESNLSRAELIEKWRDKTYCELVITKVDGYNTSRLPRIEANGIWWIDLDDGKGAQMRIEDNVQIEFEWGAQTEKKIVIYGNVTKIYNNIVDVDGNYRYNNKSIYINSELIENVNRVWIFPRIQGVSTFEAYLMGNNWTGNAPVAGSTLETYANYAKTNAYAKSAYIERGLSDVVVNNFFGGQNVSGEAVFSAKGVFGNIGGANGTTAGRLVVSVNSEAVGVSGSNYYAQKKLEYINTKLSSTAGTFGGTYSFQGLEDFVGVMPKLSDAPQLFVQTKLNTKSIIGILNKLPTYTDGAHRIGFTTTKAGAGIESEATTETFTVTDDDGTEYSVENCPRFINDDADSSLRKAYVLAIAKKGWEVII